MENISTVFIDLDDTVWWFTENSKVSLRHVYNHFGMAEFCPDYDTFKAVYLAKNKELWELYHYGKITKDFLTTERFRYTLEQTGYSGDCLAMGASVDEEYLHFLSLQPTSQQRIQPGAGSQTRFGWSKPPFQPHSALRRLRRDQATAGNIRICPKCVQCISRNQRNDW